MNVYAITAAIPHRLACKLHHTKTEKASMVLFVVALCIGATWWSGFVWVALFFSVLFVSHPVCFVVEFRVRLQLYREGRDLSEAAAIVDAREGGVYNGTSRLWRWLTRR